MPRLLRLVLSAVVLASAPGAAADVHKPRLSYGVAPASEGVSVTWNTAADGPSVVELRPEGGGEWVRHEGSSARWEPVGHYVHSVEVDGLRPWAEYRYRVGDGRTWSAEHVFRTAPENPCTPFRFVALGDERSQDDYGPDRNWAPILTEALAHGPSFVLNGGDLVNDGKEHGQWFNWLDMTDDLFAAVAHLPVLGNHDDDRIQGDGAHYNQIFTLPRNDVSGTEDYWFVRFGHLTIVALSTATFTGDGFVEQAAWMDRVFTEHPTRWKVVFFHHPVYTAGSEPLLHGPNEVGQNASFVPVFDRHHVDLVLQSHNHWYERFEPSAGGGGDEDPRPVGGEAEGTVYVTTGGAGAFTADVGDFLDWVCASQPGCAVARGEHHYILFELSANRLAASVMATAAQNFGESDDNREVIDLFSLEKAGAERVDCAQHPPAGQEAGDDPGEGGAGEGEGEGAGEGEGEGEDPGESAREGEGEGEGEQAGDGEGGGQADGSGPPPCPEDAPREDGECPPGEGADAGGAGGQGGLDGGGDLGGGADAGATGEGGGDAEGGDPLEDRRRAGIGPGAAPSSDSGCGCRQSRPQAALAGLLRR